ncbi:MAG: zinc-ribbon and DUF3426 domain-containing protein [Candidatus Methylumidiphilus sp.]
MSGRAEDCDSAQEAAALPVAPRLYTRCPGCKTTYRISVAHLRQGRGEAHCQACQAPFSVLDSLAETPARAVPGQASPGKAPLLGKLDAVAQPPAPAPLAAAQMPKPPDSGRRTAAWTVGAAMMLALLALQVGVYAAPQLAQHAPLRSSLESACLALGCDDLPPFRATAQIRIQGHALNPNGGGYEFTLAVANHAPLPQAYPAVKLVLADGNGKPAAARVFQPAEYLPATAPALMPVGRPYEIRLLLAPPTGEIGGFSFDLL